MLPRLLIQHAMTMTRARIMRLGMNMKVVIVQKERITRKIRIVNEKCHQNSSNENSNDNVHANRDSNSSDNNRKNRNTARTLLKQVYC